MLLYLKTDARVFVRLDGQKYILNSSMYELKPVRLLRLLAFKPYGEQGRYFVGNEDTRAAHFPFLFFSIVNPFRLD